MESKADYRQLVLSTNWNNLSYATHWNKASAYAICSDKSATFLLMKLYKCYHPKILKSNEYIFLLKLVFLIINSHKSFILSKTLRLAILLVLSLLSRPETSILFSSSTDQYWVSLCSFSTRFNQADEKYLYARFMRNIAYVNNLEQSEALKQINDFYYRISKDAVETAIEAITLRLNEYQKNWNHEKTNSPKKISFNRYVSPDYKSISYRQKYSALSKNREKMISTQYTCPNSSSIPSKPTPSVVLAKKTQLKTQSTVIHKKKKKRKLKSKSFPQDAMYHRLPGCYGCGKNR